MHEGNAKTEVDKGKLTALRGGQPWSAQPRWC